MTNNESPTTDWCRVCCTRHAAEGECPGELLATGDERHGWRIAVDTPRGMETFGVMVAPSGSRWRARILTYPNVLWTVPGGDGSMKFAGSTPGKAERRAIEFVERFCAQRNYPKHDALPPVETAPVDPEHAGELPPPVVRRIFSAPVRFGNKTPSRDALTVNVSERGMFVTTTAPLDPGAAIRLQLALESVTVGLKGVVMWSRKKYESGRPRGMGVRLFHPPASYTDFISRLQPGPGYVRRARKIRTRTV